MKIYYLFSVKNMKATSVKLRKHEDSERMANLEKREGKREFNGRGGGLDDATMITSNSNGFDDGLGWPYGGGPTQGCSICLSPKLNLRPNPGDKN